MNGSTENQTSGASEQDGGRDIVLTWTTSHRMLPLTYFPRKCPKSRILQA